MKPALDIGTARERPSLAACEVLPGEQGGPPVIFASPHSGQFYPEHFVDVLQVPLLDLRRTEDAFVDELFNVGRAQTGTRIFANYARTYVDLNRDARELDPRMFADGVPRTSGLPSARVKAGLGCLPRIAASGREIYDAPLPQSEGAWRLDHVYDGYHDCLNALIVDLLKSWSDIVLIDCHSMPSTQPGRGALPDIVLGDRFGSSCNGRLTRLVERAFRRHGLSVGRNAPYAGGYTTRKYGRPRRGVHALQIEINRSLYMDERQVEKSDGFEKLQTILAAVIEDICAYSQRENQ